MKSYLSKTFFVVAGWLILATPSAVQAQFNYYSSTNQTITVAQYIGDNVVVTIPSTIDGLPVTGIADGTFSGSYITAVIIPNEVTSIGDSAFASSFGLTNIIVEPLNPSYSSVDGVLFNKSQTTLVAYPGGKLGDYVIPNSVTNIGDSAFYNCSSLTSIMIPNSVTNIGDNAFNGCSSLTSITIPNGVTSIRNGAFKYCTRLSSITMPNSVTSIGNSAFGRCLSLTNFTIPNSVTSIGDYAFDQCTGLTSVYFQGNAPNVDDTVFSTDHNATVYYLPGTTGWGPTFGGIPTASWSLPYPMILNSNLGVQPSGFSFTLSWATNASVVVEASADLNNPNWSPVTTNALNNGVVNFTDPNWKNYPSRFYRVRSQ